jgi:hypothetical protein
MTDECTFTEVSNKMSLADSTDIGISSRSTHKNLRSQHPKPLPSLATWSTLWWAEGSSSRTVQRVQWCHPKCPKHFCLSQTPCLVHWGCFTAPTIHLASHWADVCSLYIDQCIYTHISSGQKKRRLPNPIQVIACSHLCPGLNVIHHGP